MKNLQVSPAAPADGDRVNRLLDAAYSRVNGTLDRSAEASSFPPRDADNRPVTYFLATLDGEDKGTAGVSALGDVLDWAIAPGPGAEDVARDLEAALEKFARASGAEEMQVFVAGDDATSIAALAARGYYEIPAPITVMRVVHFPRFVAAVLAPRNVEGFPATSVRVELGPGLYPQLLDREITIVVRDSVARVVESTTEPVDITIRTTATEFSELLLGSVKPFAFARRAAIRPWHRWGTALRLLHVLAPDRGWYSPLGERR